MVASTVLAWRRSERESKGNRHYPGLGQMTNVLASKDLDDQRSDGAKGSRAKEARALSGHLLHLILSRGYWPLAQVGAYETLRGFSRYRNWSAHTHRVSAPDALLGRRVAVDLLELIVCCRQFVVR